MERSPSWEANRFSASQKIPRIFMETEGSLPLLQQPTTCSYPEPARSSPCPHSTSWSSILILSPFAPGRSKWSLFLRFPHQNPLYTSTLPIHATCPTLLILLDLTTLPSRKMFGDHYRSLSSSLCSFLPSPVTSSLLGSNILLKTLFSNALSLRSSLNLSDHVSHL